MEGLITLLKKAGEEKKLSGVRVCRDAPVINNLLFVDDSVVFCQASV